MGDQRFLRKYRVRRPAEFERAYRRRHTASDHLIVVYGYPNGLAYPRLGLSVSRKVGNAVVRNRWKRLLREAFRISRQDLPAGIDLIVVARPGGKPSLSALLESLPRLAGILGAGL